MACLVANLSQLPFDFVARQKMGGLNVNYFIFSQLPVLSPGEYAKPCLWSGGICTIREWLLPRVLELTYTAWDLEPFARECGYSGPPFIWDEHRRFLLRCELDAAFFHLYLGTLEGWASAPHSLRVSFSEPRDAVAYIVDTFPIVRKKDEQRFGSYRTKEMILEIYDAMAEASRTGQECVSLLDPPPGDPRICAHQNNVSTSSADGMPPDKPKEEASKSGKIVTLQLRNDLEETAVVLPAA
jgi:hypothetical protein